MEPVNPMSMPPPCQRKSNRLGNPRVWGILVAVLSVPAGWAIVFFSRTAGERFLEVFAELFGMNTREYAIETIWLFSIALALLGFFSGIALCVAIQANPRRRSLQFRLKSLLILVIVVALPCAWLGWKMDLGRRE